MTAEQVFGIANSLALVGWLILIVAGRKPWAAPTLCGAVIPMILAFAYIGLLAAHWGETTGGFSSLAGVASLFSNPWMLLAGWIHYLAFDLFIGSWQVRDSAAHGIPHLAVIPCLLLTFLFGPVGLLCYLSLRRFKTGQFSL